MDVQGRHVLVTGASHGIGVDIARGFAARGARVTVLGRDASAVAAVAAEVGGWELVADLSDPAALGEVVARAESRGGPLDVLVNNAGLSLVGAASQAEPGAARRMMDVNAVAPMELCRQALPGMLERGRGHIVNVSTLAAVSAVPDLPLYGASKAALHHYTSILQRELAGTPVGVTLVTLGEVAGTHLMELARRSPIIAAVSKRLSRLMPVLTTEAAAAGIVDSVRREAPVVTVPRRMAGAVVLRNLPSTLQDAVFIGLKP
jgi:short-subunit dehydrogenase